MKRITAIVAAVTMVVVSLFIRSRIDDDSSNGDRPRDDGGRPVVACVTELADACHAAYGDSIELRVEDANKTAAALAKGNKDLDAWVTLSGWPELLAVKGIKPPLAVTRVASTALVIAAVKERADVLPCAANGWSCFLESAGKLWTALGGKPEWGTAVVGLPPATSASGLVLEATAIAGEVGTTEVGTNDATFADARALLGNLDASVADPFTAFAVQLPARFSAVGALQADVQSKSGTKADLITTITLTPPATVNAVIARLGGRRSIEADKLAKALTSAGWAPPTDATGLPDGGVLLALSGIS